MSSQLVQEWRAAADLCTRFGANETAAALRQCAAELEASLAQPPVRFLTLREAAVTCGYSEDHLGRLVRQGVLRNYGRRGRPRVAAGELPYRAVAPTLQGTYDPVADAQELLQRRRA